MGLETYQVKVRVPSFKSVTLCKRPLETFVKFLGTLTLMSISSTSSYHVIFVRPPSTRAQTLTSRSDERNSIFVIAPSNSSVPRRTNGNFGFASIKHDKFFILANILRCDQIYIKYTSFSLKFQFLSFLCHFRNFQWFLKINLHSIVRLQNFVTNGIRTRNRCCRQDLP